MLKARKNLFLVLVSAVTALGLAFAAEATTLGDVTNQQVLNTSPLYADSASYHTCLVVNVTIDPVNVAIEMINAAGSVIAGSTTFVSLAAGTSTVLNDDSNYVGFARCRFTIVDAPATIRANLTIFHSLGNGNFQTYAISEAR